MSSLIYILDDDPKILDIISKYLRRESFDVMTFDTGAKLMSAAKEKLPDCFVLDIMLPDTDGYTLCKELTQMSSVPIIFVSARDEKIDRIIGLEIGADDYLSKPFSPRELVARVKVCLRRTAYIKKDIDERKKVSVGNTDIDISGRKVLCGKKLVELTGREFGMLVMLTKSLGKAYSREELYNEIWGWEYTQNSRSIDDLVKRLRKKLLLAQSSISVNTVWGYGYKAEEQQL